MINKYIFPGALNILLLISGHLASADHDCPELTASDLKAHESHSGLLQVFIDKDQKWNKYTVGWVGSIFWKKAQKVTSVTSIGHKPHGLSCVYRYLTEEQPHEPSIFEIHPAIISPAIGPILNVEQAKKLIAEYLAHQDAYIDEGNFDWVMSGSRKKLRPDVKAIKLDRTWVANKDWSKDWDINDKVSFVSSSYIVDFLDDSSTSINLTVKPMNWQKLEELLD